MYKIELFYQKIILFLFVVIFASGLKAEDDSITLLIGEWPPFCSEYQKNYGILSQIVKESFNEVGIEVKLEWMTWNGALENSKASKKYAGTFGWAKEPYKESFFLFSEEGLFRNEHGFFHRKDFDFDWINESDLSGLKIGHTKSYTYFGDLKKAVDLKIPEVEIVDTDSINFKKLINRRIDLFDCNVLVGQVLLKTKFTEKEREQITYHPKFIADDDVYLLISKQYPNAEYYINKFNEGFSILKKTGKYKEIVKDIEGRSY